MSFEPKQKVELDPPKDDLISEQYLSRCDGRPTNELKRSIEWKLRNGQGTQSDYPTYVAIKGTVFDVSGNKMYGPDGSYKLFAGKDASRALAQSSLKPEDCRPDWYDLADEHKKVLNDWHTFFSKRYNIKGKVEGATNT